MNKKFYKDKDATLDYMVDWRKWLDGDTITTSTWTVETGITEVDASYTTTEAFIWLSGGTVGEEYNVMNRINTSSGRVDDRTLIIEVTEK